MQIERTSKLIKSIYEDDPEFDNIDYNTTIEEQFNTYFKPRVRKINYNTIEYFLQRFNSLHLHVSFKEPLIVEYFCQKLNFYLVIDFVISLLETDMTKLSSTFVFDFFVRLGEFFDFMNFLDVDESFLQYLKYMLVLYLLMVDRSIIEIEFSNTITILDDFFIHYVMRSVFAEENYKKINDYHKNIIPFLKNVKDFNNNINYQLPEYNKVDKLFNTYNKVIIIVKKLEKIPNPTFIEHNNIDDIDDNIPEYTYKLVNVIEETDPNYNEYKQLFIYRKYQFYKNLIDPIKQEIKSYSMSVKISDYSQFDKISTNETIINIRTILGITQKIDNTINNLLPKHLFYIACTYGHIELMKDIYSQYKIVLSKQELEIIKTNYQLEVYNCVCELISDI